MAQTVVTPSEQARRVAAALHRVPSVQDIRWTADQVVCWRQDWLTRMASTDCR